MHDITFAVKKDFKFEGKAAKLGFPAHIYSFEKKYSFYADTCIKIWEHVIKNGIRSFDTEIKKALLKNVQIPCSVLLVDECQDLDQCQVAWVEEQKKFGMSDSLPTSRFIRLVYFSSSSQSFSL